MQRALIHIILVVGLIMASGCAKKESVGGVQKNLGLTVINSISFTEEAVVLQMSGEFSQSFTVAKPYDPYTIIIEVPGVHAGDLAEEIKPDVAALEVVRISTVQTPTLLTRLELVLAKPMDVVPRKDGQFLVLDMLESGAAFEKASERPLIAHLLAEYILKYGKERLPKVEPIFTTNPFLRSSIPGKPSLVSLTGPYILDMTTLRISSSEEETTGLKDIAPALFK